MRSDPDASEQDGNGVDNCGSRCGLDLNHERVYNHEWRDTQWTIDLQFDYKYNCNPLQLEDYDIQNSQDSNTVLNNEDQPWTEKVSKFDKTCHVNRTWNFT